MGRWEPDAQGRMRRAALDLYVEQGFEQTTVADIAARAGVTERTFFRYFADKREVLFAGSEHLVEQAVAAVAAAPDDASALDAALAGVVAATAGIADRSWSRQRAAALAAAAPLQERELLKMAVLTQGLAGALAERGVDAARATLVAETAVTAFKVGFERWIASDSDAAFADHVTETLAALRSVVAEPATAP